MRIKVRVKIKDGEMAKERKEEVPNVKERKQE